MISSYAPLAERVVIRVKLYLKSRRHNGEDQLGTPEETPVGSEAHHKSHCLSAGDAFLKWKLLYPMKQILSYPIWMLKYRTREENAS